VITDNPVFGLKVKNLAIINARQEFQQYLEALSDDEFVRRLGNMRFPHYLPLITWRGLPMGLLTMMLQRSILGVESCVSAAVEYRLTAEGLLTDELALKLNDPVKLPGKPGMAETFYNKLPAQIDPALQLEMMEPELWATVKRFYKEVRNPLFHGYELADINAAGGLEALRMLASVYNWMDKWWGAFGSVTAGNPMGEES
jgi:hypothetical protein